MRPRIGKTPHWDKVSPSEQKEIDKRAKKWVIVKYLQEWSDPAYWDIQSKWVYKVVEDNPILRWQVERHPNAEIVMEKLTAHDAGMWVKMMK